MDSTAQLDNADRFGRRLLDDSLPELTVVPLDDYFIARHINQPITVFLFNGVKLSGVITTNSPNSFLLARDGVTQLVMKHAVATILPAESV
jgi:host factor-I protein